MDEETKREIMRSCTCFMCYHYPRSVRNIMEEVAASELSLLPADRYGTTGFTILFEQEISKLLGKEAAVFMPSGTMAQQIALRIWSDLSGVARLAFHPTCHLEIHEQNGYRELHHLQAVLLGSKERLFTLEDLEKIDEPISTLLIELPQREIGGQLPTWEELVGICDYAKSKGWKIHMDGARLWECAPFYDRSYEQICSLFDSVYVSFYKIMGGLPGAVLAGPAEVIANSKVWQRRHGGNLFQLSPNAISAKLGMEKHLPSMGAYVRRAAEIAALLRDFGKLRVQPEHPPTNMFHLFLTGDKTAIEEAVYAFAAETNCLLFPGLAPTDRADLHKLEVVIGNAGLDVPDDVIRAGFEKLVG